MMEKEENLAPFSKEDEKALMDLYIELLIDVGRNFLLVKKVKADLEEEEEENPSPLEQANVYITEKGLAEGVVYRYTTPISFSEASDGGIGVDFNIQVQDHKFSDEQIEAMKKDHQNPITQSIIDFARKVAILYTLVELIDKDGKIWNQYVPFREVPQGK